MNILTDNIKSVLALDEYDGYIDNYYIHFSNDSKYIRIDLFKENMIIDEVTYNTSFKKINKLNYDINRININDKEFIVLNLVPIKYIRSYEDLKLKIEEIRITKNRPSLLIHSCCGPCSSEVLTRLYPYFNITIYYYNPNIDTLEEFQKRLDVQKEIIKKLNMNIDVIAPEYDHDSYLAYIKGYENCKEHEKRCYLCYKQRLESLASCSNGFDYITTTLSISPYKSDKWINEIGFNLENKYNTVFMYSNFKLEEGYKKSIVLSKIYNLYRQEYCGCEFSKRDLIDKKNI